MPNTAPKTRCRQASPDHTEADLSWLVGGGEMGERIRTLDWSKTPLGPIEQWPQSLKTSVSTSLGSAFPMVVLWGSELVLIYNDEYRPILGAKHPAALGHPIARAWATIWDVIGPMFNNVMEKGEATRSRDMLLHVDRHGYPEEAYFSFSYSPIHAEKGRIGGVFCPVIETTDKVIGERRLRTLRDLAAACQGSETETAAFRAATSVLAANPHDVPFAILYRIDDGQESAQLEVAVGIDPGSSAVQQSMPLSEEEVRDAGQSWSLGTVVKTGKPAIVTDLASRFTDLPKGPWKVPPHSAMVYPILLPGQERPRAILVAAVSPMRPLDEDYQTFFGLIATQIASGLADAQALEAERRRARALEEIDRTKTEFFSNVSHELRTPLTLMLGPLEEEMREYPGSRPRLELAHRNSLRLLKLVNALLDFSRIEAGRIQACYEPTDLSAFTAELASGFRSAIENAGLKLLMDCPPLTGPMYVDREMWEKIVLNLLSNAFKFTFSGEIEVKLRTGIDDRAHLTVRDTGTGIVAEELARIFERFHRVRDARSRTHEGTGIGLALVQEMVRLHGGEVRASSTVGQGTTFTISIPIGAAHLPQDRITASRTLQSTATRATAFIEEALHWMPVTNGEAEDLLNSGGPTPMPNGESSVQKHSANGASGHVAPARILFADDNADMREYVSRLLRSHYRVTVVPDGRAALEAARAQRPDLILSDVMMPRLDGFGLVRELRAGDATRTIPIILLSARAGEEARIEGVGHGADDYLIKPFSARELLARIESHLKLARLRHDAERRVNEINLHLEKRVQERTRKLTEVSQMRQELLRQLLSAQEEERGRIARDLHDDTGQQVAAMLLGLHQIATSTAVADAALKKTVLQVRAIAQDVAEKSHRLAVTLRPTILDDMGLVPALSQFSRQWSQWAGIPVDVAFFGVENRLSPEFETTIYRVVQEALTNVLRHALKGRRKCAKRVSIVIRRGVEDVVTVIEDDGPGFNVRAALSPSGAGQRIGIFGMQERARLAGGTVTIESAPGEGTRLYLRLPLPPTGAKDSSSNKSTQLITEMEPASPS